MTITWCAMKYQDFFITLTSIVLSNFIKKRNDDKVNSCLFYHDIYIHLISQKMLVFFDFTANDAILL